ncbi:UNVERIFIED_CONTAM: hypothetical protein Sradi_6430800 [Sesamum radiatum]|uniref:Uncharacterized protein n=1 Tax=Sesamum radiatum TaxID=300843 RepID=A0AAW2K726_SESRA
MLPKSTHNLLGYIKAQEKWWTAKEALFSELSIKGNLKEETYLAAYLPCSLCMFVLLGKGVNSIHPNTFKMTSTMANDQRVSLAIPVLASIYGSLNTIVTFSRLARTSSSFSIHFTYKWLAYYFKPYTKEKGVSPVTFLAMVRYAHSTPDSSSTQFPLRPSGRVFRCCNIILLATST